MTNLAYFDCPSGASGDMILAAFLDAGLPFDHLKAEVLKLELTGYELHTEKVLKQGLAARHFHVRIEPQHHHRRLADIRQLIQAGGLDDRVKDMAVAVFEKLAGAEGRVHNLDPEQVHFHEVGAVDSIVDIVGAAVAWRYFRLDQAVVSELPLGSGFVETAHGRLPLPAPATLVLLEGAPTYGAGLKAEMVTPTGAAILTTLAGRFGPRPAMTITATGYGAGRRDLPDRPNALRLTLGRASAPTFLDHLVMAETNLDDLNPEILPYLLDRLLAAGALDAWFTPIQMKKGRPAVKLSVLARPGRMDELIQIILAESTTLGVRTFPVERQALAREIMTVTTPWGQAGAKKISRDGWIEIVPEFEACRRIAESSGKPIREVYEEVKKLGETLL
ncbi:MAG: nickel pincer cofactor biosynthesis protein LarC [Thermodesulfobacteriota bacterium]